MYGQSPYSYNVCFGEDTYNMKTLIRVEDVIYNNYKSRWGRATVTNLQNNQSMKICASTWEVVQFNHVAKGMTFYIIGKLNEIGGKTLNQIQMIQSEDNLQKRAIIHVLFSCLQEDDVKSLQQLMRIHGKSALFPSMLSMLFLRCLVCYSFDLTH